MSNDRQVLERIAKILRPFARSAVALRPNAPDDEPVIAWEGAVILTAGDFRRARQAIEEVDQWLQSH